MQLLPSNSLFHNNNKIDISSGLLVVGRLRSEESGK